jgi:oligoendopeptidase F
MNPSVLLVCAVVGASAAAARSTGDPPLAADLARYYFASPDAEVAARADLEAALARLQTRKGHLTTGSQLLQALRGYEEVERIYRRHEGYLHLRCSLNRKDAACEADDRLESEVSARTAFLAPEVLALSGERLQALCASEPGLQPYRFALEQMRRGADHVLPGEEQALLDRFGPEIADWQYDLYQQVLAGIRFGVVDAGERSFDVIRQRNILASNPDPRVREEAFTRRFRGFASQRDLLAFALIHTVRAQQALAQAHRYPDAPARTYSSIDTGVAQTRSLLREMAQRGEVTRRFEKVRARDFENAYGTPMRAWDVSAPLPGVVPPVTTLADAARILHDAFAGLGPEYQAAFDGLLLGGNGRADILPGGAPDRYQGGFSIGFQGATSILFFGRYDGTFKDLSVIAHEGGHAVHRSLMDSNGVKPLYADGPSFLSESFAAFNELVLAGYLAEQAADPRLRRYYRKEWMSIKGLDAFYGAQDAVLEQDIYDGVSAGRIRGADDLDRVTLAVDGQFSALSAVTPELRARWAAVSLMFEDPLYDVNYVYGGLLALKYYQLYTADREDFVPRYIALLKHGFDMTPAGLLKRFLNVDFSPSLLLDDLDLLDQRLRQLEGGE